MRAYDWLVSGVTDRSLWEQVRRDSGRAPDDEAYQDYVRFILAIFGVKEEELMASIVDRVEVYLDEQHQWRWRALARNNRNVANGGEGYHNREDMMDAIRGLLGDDVRIVELES